MCCRFRDQNYIYPLTHLTHPISEQVEKYLQSITRGYLNIIMCNSLNPIHACSEYFNKHFALKYSIGHCVHSSACSENMWSKVICLYYLSFLERSRMNFQLFFYLGYKTRISSRNIKTSPANILYI